MVTRLTLILLTVFTKNLINSTEIQSSENDPNECFDFSINQNMPCSPYDTINITAGIKNSDDSITYDGVTYNKSEYRTYDYICNTDLHKIRVENHIRACICSHRICVRSCCQKDEILENGQCTLSSKTQIFNVTIYDNNISQTHNLQNDSQYGIVFGDICSFISSSMHNNWILIKVM